MLAFYGDSHILSIDGIGCRRAAIPVGTFRISKDQFPSLIGMRLTIEEIVSANLSKENPSHCRRSGEERVYCRLFLDRGIANDIAANYFVPIFIVI